MGIENQESEGKYPIELVAPVVFAAVYSLCFFSLVAFLVYSKETFSGLLDIRSIFAWVFWAVFLGEGINLLFALYAILGYKRKASMSAGYFFMLFGVVIYDVASLGACYFLWQLTQSDL